MRIFLFVALLWFPSFAVNAQENTPEAVLAALDTTPRSSNPVTYQQLLDSGLSLCPHFESPACFRLGIRIAENQRYLGLLEEAKSSILKLEPQLDSMPMRLQASFWGRKAAIYNELKTPFPEVRKLLENGLSIAESINDTALIAGSNFELGFIDEHEGAYRSAVRKYQQAAHLFWLVGDYENWAAAMNNLSRTHYRKGKYQQVIAVAREVDRLNRPEFNTNLRVLYEHHAQALIALGRYQEAIPILKKERDHTFQIIDNEWKSEIAQYQAKVQLQEEKKARADEILKNEILAQRLHLQRITLLAITIILLLLIGLLFFVNKSRKRSQKAMEELGVLNQQKDYLLKEVHHRVKNNLQSLQSLFTLQKGQLSSDSHIHLIESSIRRIEAISYTHHLLYTNDLENTIDLRMYMDHLLPSLNFIANSETQFQSSISPVVVDLEMAIAIGMISSEIISNTQKYAKPEKGALQAKLQVVETDGSILFHYHDNGEAFPWNTETNPAGLGLKIIDILIKKLDGQILETQKPYSLKFIFAKNNGGN